MISETDLSVLSSSFSGDILTPDKTGYDDSRKVWNGMIDRKPGVIFKCRSREDVIAGIKFARQNNLLLSIKAGGHSIGGLAINDGGVVLDLSLMNKVTVNNKNGTSTVIAGGGSLMRDLDTAAGQFNLAVPAGIISHTGIAGLTLGGGFGWISRKFGLTIDKLLSADIVNADGEVLTASRNENPELFWGLKGGGGNFGAVTSLEFEGSEIPPEIMAGIIIRPISEAANYLRFHRDFVRTLPDEMTVWSIMRYAPPLPAIPQEIQGKLVILTIVVYAGPKEKGEELIKPVVEFSKPWAKIINMLPYHVWQKNFDAGAAFYLRNYWKSHNINVLSDTLIDKVIGIVENFPTPMCQILIPHMEGLPSRIPDEDSAYSFRSIPFGLHLHTRWEKPEDDKRMVEFAEKFYNETKPFAQGVYVNFISDEGPDRVRDAYNAKTWKQLVEVKNMYDPDNFFRCNQNIKPSVKQKSDVVRNSQK